ncbi:hypothetical protein DOTSEDRAFT_159290 [Dothistroma septosporum NZE10]|uniref:Inosine/uridine-preferring nucleoside hydrolase domain-containing protein n=1 Tax=Dothistroma septosporum (strain NZE10 / CBS 128990) TaxID=675120 RepID=M2YJL6_DOTSN|nr:hypothetical protein DOTSEDRAFT_159290 [Dothistroma septosporum NZE10]
MTDVDDVGALAVANVLHNCGLCDLRGVMVNTPSKYGALTASVVNTYFGNGDVPIAAMRPLTSETFLDQQTFLYVDYASKVAHNFPRALEDAEQTSTPGEIYSSILESASDGSVTIISIGFLDNLAGLISSVEGHALVSAKVAELVIMGGEYPSGWEFNFGGVHPWTTAKVIEGWPSNVPITYSGLELGMDIMSGEGLKQRCPADSPILAAYEWYNGRCNTVRESWDPLTVLYGVLGLDRHSALGLSESPFVYANADGYNSITAMNGSNAWVDDSSVTNQHWLKLADGISNTSMANLLTQLYARDPGSASCMIYAAHPDL